jgi:hypothetical protein
MSRHRSSSAYSHGISKLGDDWFRISWTVDFYYPDSRLRHPRRFSRHTDLAGAKRFKKKWSVADYRLPDELKS